MKSISSFFGLPLLATAVAFAGCGSEGETSVQRAAVVSPSGDLQMVVTTDEPGQWSYTVSHRGKTVIESSPLGLAATTHELTSGVAMSSPRARAIEESYTSPTGKRRERQVSASEVTVPLRDANGARAELIMRAHDDGVAFRYHLLGEGTSRVTSESTGFAIASGSRVLTRAYDSGDGLFVVNAGSYEQAPEVLSIGAAIGATGFAYPTFFETQDDEPHVMITEADLGRSYCGTRLHENPDQNLYSIRFPDEREGRGIGEVLPESSLPLMTPWRVIAIGDLATVFESTLVDDLSAPSVVDDPSWIKPGRAAWSWFSQETGTPELQSEYVDFAGEHGWEYVLIDAKWDQWDDAEQAVKDLVTQADAVGVKLLLWYNSGGPHTTWPGETPLNRMLEPVRRDEMEKISGWGVAGIKVDFFNSDKQDRINQYIGILEDARDFELLVNFHGATVPRGWQRTYPHLMTAEAVNGAEFYKFAGVGGSPTALMNVRHALLRNVVGSMDYTPVVFESALRTVGLPYAHSLALSIIFESGIQHFADRADSNTALGYRVVFADYPYVGDFLSTVPVAWDDTRLLSSDIDGHVILARRRGADWYLAGIESAEASTEHSIFLDFLGGGTYEVSWIVEGATADSFKLLEGSAEAGDSLGVVLPARGGFVAKLTPQ